MPNICENVIEIQGTLKNVEKLLDTCKTVGHEGRFDNNESIEVYDLTLGREMPSEFHTIATVEILLMALKSISGSMYTKKQEKRFQMV